MRDVLRLRPGPPPTPMPLRLRVPVFRLVVLRLPGAVLRLRAAVFRLAVLRFAVVRLREVVLRFVAPRLREAVFRFAVLRFAAPRLPAAVFRFAVLRFAAPRLREAVFRFAVLRFAVVRFVVVRLREPLDRRRPREDRARVPGSSSKRSPSCSKRPCSGSGAAGGLVMPGSLAAAQDVLPSGLPPSGRAEWASRPFRSTIRCRRWDSNPHEVSLTGF